MTSLIRSTAEGSGIAERTPSTEWVTSGNVDLAAATKLRLLLLDARNDSALDFVGRPFSVRKSSVVNTSLMCKGVLCGLYITIGTSKLLLPAGNLIDRKKISLIKANKIDLNSDATCIQPMGKVDKG